VADASEPPGVPSSNYYGRVYFDHFDMTIRTQNPIAALNEAYRILRPGGIIAIFGADERTIIVQNLRQLGFENVEVSWVPWLTHEVNTATFEFTATKPSAKR
jgi:hypothetical protein